MYYVSKILEIAASHHLELDYPSKCCGLHGHNYRIEVFCKGPELDSNGMLWASSSSRRESSTFCFFFFIYKSRY